MDWIHFIGKKYYTIVAFVAEAKKIGISRRISPANLKKMSFGDRIFLASGDSKGSEIFGYFVFDNILGLDINIIDNFCKEGIIQDSGVEPHSVSRGCGSYNVANIYQVVDKNKLLEGLKDLDNDDLKGVLIGGKFHELKDANELLFKSETVKTAIVFQQGYRLFNYDLFETLYRAELKSDKKRIQRLKNQFYVPRNEEKMRQGEELPFAIVTGIMDYMKFDN